MATDTNQTQTSGPSTLDLAFDNGYFVLRAMAERLERIQDAILSGKVTMTPGLLEEILELDSKLEDLG